ncbi:LPXTG cell wall anchor domain-containing protein [Enterococcus sp. DIV0240a]|jgi:LPXTG-motif cell wall-anchored protein|uniref:LPXTG cell wall anchor domain-containing protein n=1 Tax=Enterococcus sp. DIV0240a TaxID=2774651 RepID=UPI003D2BC3F7
MRKKHHKWWYLLVLVSFLFGNDTAAAEYPAGNAGNTSVGITFEGEDQEREAELSITNDTNQADGKTAHLPKTGEMKQNSYLFLGILCLIFVINRKKGEPE